MKPKNAKNDNGKIKLNRSLAGNREIETKFYQDVWEKCKTAICENALPLPNMEKYVIYININSELAYEITFDNDYFVWFLSWLVVNRMKRDFDWMETKLSDCEDILRIAKEKELEQNLHNIASQVSELEGEDIEVVKKRLLPALRAKQNKK